MTNSIEKFDPSRLMEGVRDRVKATFVSLIPDEQWEQMVKTECDRFFTIYKNKYSHNRDEYSDFQLVCLQEMKEITKDKIKEALTKYESTIWKNNEVEMSEMLKDLLIKNASELFTAMIGNRIQTVLMELKNRSY